MRVVGCLVALLATVSLASAGEVPPWLAAAAATAPASGDTGRAVVLLAEQTVRVTPSGKVLTLERCAIRVLRREGSEDAIGRVVYDTDAEEVRNLEGWIVPAGAAGHRLPATREADLALLSEDVYNEVRVRVVSGRGDAMPGDVFGYEWAREGRQVIAQFDWDFQDELPCHISRFTLEVPPGWTATAVVRHHAPVEPRIEGDQRTWELRDLPGLGDEPACPPVTSLAPQLLVSCGPEPGAKPGEVVALSTWADVVHWLDQLTAPMSTPTPEVTARAREVAHGARSEIDTIRSIGRWVQGVRYASIPLGLHRGGGYRPVPAATALARGYGDCKDKANLMRSMLAAIGVEAWLVPVYAGDADYAEERWPSPQSFNHCIVAIRARPGDRFPATIQDPTLGAVTLFDPTDRRTTFGDLPAAIQGSLALLIAPGTQAPLRVPQLTTHSLLERHATLAIAEEGTLTGRFDDQATGQMAAEVRRLVEGLGVGDRRAAYERWLSRRASGARVGSIEAVDDSVSGRMTTHIEFALMAYGQVLQGRLLMFKPFVLSTANESALALTETRRHPIVLSAQAIRETVLVRLPEGFKVDELPEAVALEASWGRYVATVRRSGPDLQLTRSIEVTSDRLPADQSAAVGRFYRAIWKFENSPVVLAHD